MRDFKTWRKEKGYLPTAGALLFLLCLLAVLLHNVLGLSSTP